MSPLPDPTVQLRPYTGAAELERPLLELTAGTWRGRAVVRRYRFRGRAGDHFAIAVSWHGPPMQGFEPEPAIADREDMLMVRDVELARAIAMAAIDELRATRVPDLRALARRFNRAE